MIISLFLTERFVCLSNKMQSYPKKIISQSQLVKQHRKTTVEVNVFCSTNTAYRASTTLDRPKNPINQSKTKHLWGKNRLDLPQNTVIRPQNVIISPKNAVFSPQNAIFSPKNALNRS